MRNKLLRNILITLSICSINLFVQDLYSDTLSISTNSVIFFEIPQSEYNNLSNREVFRIDSLTTNLHQLRDRIIPFFRKHNINVKTAYNRYFRVLTNQDTILISSENYSEAGIILYCLEKPPMILPGNITETDLLSKAQKYFKEILSK